MEDVGLFPGRIDASQRDKRCSARTWDGGVGTEVPDVLVGRVERMRPQTKRPYKKAELKSLRRGHGFFVFEEYIHVWRREGASNDRPILFRRSTPSSGRVSGGDE